MGSYQHTTKQNAAQSFQQHAPPTVTPQPPQVQQQTIQAKSNEEGLAEHAERLRKFQRLGNSMIQMGPPRFDNHMTSSVKPKPWIQGKLTIGEPGDKYEQEADRVASQVAQHIKASTFKENSMRESIQREKDLEGVMYARVFQAAIQRKQAIAGGEATPNLESAINRARGSGQPLDLGLQQSMGQAMGANFSGVRVHTDAQSDHLNQPIQAKTIKTDQEELFGEGAYKLGLDGGQELIAHELAYTLQRKSDLTKAKLLQGKFSAGKMLTQQQARSTLGDKHTGMPDHLKTGLEQLSGLDLSGVRVHYGSDKPAKLNAHAYTQGQDIELGAKQERNLPHEGWHVIQQMQGRVKPTFQSKGVSINDDSKLESEADIMGAKALQIGVQVASKPNKISAEKVHFNSRSTGQVTNVVQRVKKSQMGVILVKVRKKIAQEGFEAQVTVPGVKDHKGIQEWWELLTEQVQPEKLESLSKEVAAEILFNEKTKNLKAVKKKIAPPVFLTDKTVFRKPPKLLSSDNKEIEGKPIQFSIKGLGTGVVVLYQDLERKSYDNTLAWMSHGLQVSDGVKSLDKARSFGFVVGKNENLLRPEQSGGFDSLIESFKEKASGDLPRESKAPDILLGAHEPDIDFPKDTARQAIGSMLPKCDVAILIDFVPFEDLDEEYITDEMEYLGFTYPPLNKVIDSLPSLNNYDDFLMLCCRTDLVTKMQGTSGVIPNSNQVVSFNPELNSKKDTGGSSVKQEKGTKQQQTMQGKVLDQVAISIAGSVARVQEFSENKIQNFKVRDKFRFALSKNIDPIIMNTQKRVSRDLGNVDKILYISKKEAEKIAIEIAKDFGVDFSDFKF